MNVAQYFNIERGRGEERVKAVLRYVHFLQSVV